MVAPSGRWVGARDEDTVRRSGDRQRPYQSQPDPGARIEEQGRGGGLSVQRARRRRLLRDGEFGDYRTFPVSLSPAIRGASRAGVPSRDSLPCVSGKICVPSIVASTIWSSATSSRSVPMLLAAGANPASPSAIRRASTGPFRAGESGFNRQLMRHFAPVRQSLGLHWFHFGQPLLPPIVDPLEPVPDNQQILVYLPFEQTETIAALLSRFSPQSFICFHPEVRKRSEWRNIRFEPQAREGSSWRWPVVAGSSAMRDSSLPPRRSPRQEAAGQTPGWPVRAVDQRQDPGTDGAGPVDGQPGCQCGAKLAGGPSWQGVRYPDVAGELADWLLAGAGEEVGALSRRLWGRTLFRRRCVTAWGACQPYRPGASLVIPTQRL